MKIEKLAAVYAAFLESICCPVCRSPFHLKDGSLLCQEGHCFDLSKKGYVNLAPTHCQATEKYDDPLFAARKTVFDAGFYTPVLQCIADICRKELPPSFSMADIGCGEGYYTRSLHNLFREARFFGLDISRDAVTAAARMDQRPAWMVADLKHLPFPDSSLDALLDVLTPADYSEFKRVLKSGGILIKAIPGRQYLCQIREAVKPFLSRSEAYDNQPVIDHLKANCAPVREYHVGQTFPLQEEQSRAFLHMTPMTFSVPEEALKDITLHEITIDMQVFLYRKP